MPPTVRCCDQWQPCQVTSTHATVDAVAVDVAAVMTNVTEMMTVVRHAWQLVVTEQE